MKRDAPISSSRRFIMAVMAVLLITLNSSTVTQAAPPLRPAEQASILSIDCGNGTTKRTERSAYFDSVGVPEKITSLPKEDRKAARDTKSKARQEFSELWKKCRDDADRKIDVSSSAKLSAERHAPEVPQAEQSPTPPAVEPVSPAVEPLTSTGTTIEVKTSEQLQHALNIVSPSQTIHLADGTYLGQFYVPRSGTAEKPITIRGSRNAVIDGSSGVDYTTAGDYTLHLDTVSYVILDGFTVTKGQKGVMTDEVNHSLLLNLKISGSKQEALHLRNYSSDNIVRSLDIPSTTLASMYAEGVYIGTAESNLNKPTSRTGGKPDTSDRNVIEDLDIASTADESVDIKEGTTGTILRHTRMNAKGMRSGVPDSCVDIKGLDVVLEDNSCTNFRTDGYQQHTINGVSLSSIASDRGNTCNGSPCTVVKYGK